MSPPATATRPGSANAAQPSFWKRYSAHGECPLSFVGSVLLHTLVPLGVVLLVIWGSGPDGENSKPPQMDMVEIEGDGGGLGGTSVGPGSANSGAPSRTEAASSNTPQQLAPSTKMPDIKLKDLPTLDLTMPAWDDSAEAKDGDILAYLERERTLGEKILASQSNNSTAKAGGGGGAGGPKGPGLGSRKGPGKGISPTGGVLTEQQRHSLRWLITASYDGKEHLRKLQALKAILVIPSVNHPGTALRFDLSKPTLAPQHIKLQLDEEKVRWFNTNPIEMRTLAEELKLSEVPKVSIIYLPPALEADMARRELAHQGAQENEIEKTVWDVRLIDGSYENTPHIVEQRLYKRGK
jgi:hypothetical protein